MKPLRTEVDRWTSFSLWTRLFIIAFIITIPVAGFATLIEDWRLVSSPTNLSGPLGVGPRMGDVQEIRAEIELSEFDISKSEATLSLNMFLEHLPASYESASFERLEIETDEKGWSVYSPSIQEGELRTGQLILSNYKISIPTRDFGLFPYDRHELRVSLWIEGKYKTRSGQVDNRTIPITPYVYIRTHRYYIDIFGEGVDVYIERGAQTYRGVVDKGTIEIRIRQHLLPRTLYPLAIFLLLLFSVTVVAVKDLSGMLEVSVAILLGIWGVRQILVPDKLEMQLSYGVDQSLLIVYLTFTCSVLIWFLIRIRVRRAYKNTANRPPETSVPGINSRPHSESESIKRSAEASPARGNALSRSTRHSERSGVKLSPVILVICFIFWVIHQGKKSRGHHHDQDD
jgi:hypothetical protein